jgi:hypothetical protein
MKFLDLIFNLASFKKIFIFFIFLFLKHKFPLQND